jgi:hypothetical protein
MPTSTLYLGVFYMPQSYYMGPTSLLPLRRKACWGILRSKNPTASTGCEPANLGTKGQHAISRPPKLLCRSVQKHSDCVHRHLTVCYSGTHCMFRYPCPLRGLNITRTDVMVWPWRILVTLPAACGYIWNVWRILALERRNTVMLYTALTSNCC